MGQTVLTGQTTAVADGPRVRRCHVSLARRCSSRVLLVINIIRKVSALASRILALASSVAIRDWHIYHIIQKLQLNQIFQGKLFQGKLFQFNKRSGNLNKVCCIKFYFQTISYGIYCQFQYVC